MKINLKNLNLPFFRINNSVFINDSLCSYCKILRGKYKKLSLNKSIHAFKVSNASTRLKIYENDRVYIITHLIDLEELFPGNRLLSNGKGDLYAPFFVIVY